MARKPSHPEPEPEPDEPDPPAPPPESAPPPAAAVRTVADEQRERSEQIAGEGVEKWKAEHDERSEEDKKSHQVPGVAPPAPEGGSWQGSTRSTPAARAAQNPSASR